MLEALRSKYGSTVQEARTRLTSLKRDTKLSLTDHATEIKKLVEAAYADLPRTPTGNDIGPVLKFIEPCLLAEAPVGHKPQSLTEAVQAGNEYLQIRPSANPGMAIRQVE